MKALVPASMLTPYRFIKGFRQNNITVILSIGGNYSMNCMPNIARTVTCFVVLNDVKAINGFKSSHKNCHSSWRIVMSGISYSLIIVQFIVASYRKWSYNCVKPLGNLYTAWPWLQERLAYMIPIDRSICLNTAEGTIQKRLQFVVQSKALARRAETWSHFHIVYLLLDVCYL